MLTTAKSFQLLDASGINISPVTDITSLYYEVEQTRNDETILTRKYVYSGFPVAVNINPDVCTYIGKNNYASYDPSIGKYYKITDTSNQDIIVSNISTSIIPGTTYRQFNIKNYNLTEILKSYTTREMFDASINNIDVSINILNSSTQNLYDSLNIEVFDFSTLMGKCDSNSLYPSKFYLINNYCTDNNGIMYLPKNTDDMFISKNKLKYILVKAYNASTLDGKIYEMFDNNLNPQKVYGNYKIVLDDNINKIQITYLKDNNGNEAPYDFKNLAYRISNNTPHYLTFENVTALNNIIKTNPYNSSIMPVFASYQNSNSIVKNNYIGYDCSIFILTQYLAFINNIIKGNNIMYVKNNSNIDIKNMIMNNHNSIINTQLLSNLKFEYVYINNNNNIEFAENKAPNINKLIINSSNNITIKNNDSESLTNITILNNCNGEFVLQPNIIIDNCQTSVDINTNSVYLFGQNVYAASFNTFK